MAPRAAAIQMVMTGLLCTYGCYTTPLLAHASFVIFAFHLIGKWFTLTSVDPLDIERIGLLIRIFYNAPPNT